MKDKKIFFITSFLVLCAYGTMFSQDSAHGASSNPAPVQMLVPETTNVTEEEFYPMLSDHGKILYNKLEPQGKSVVLRIASIPQFKNKDIAVKLAVELGWGPTDETTEKKPGHATGNPSKLVSKNDQSTTDQDKIVVRKIRHMYVEHIYPVEGKSIEPEALTIIADDGIVTLKGALPTEKQKNTLIGWSRLIKGVKTINDQVIIK